MGPLEGSGQGGRSASRRTLDDKWRTGRDSNPRSFRSTVFKTAAIDLSATRPLIMKYTEPPRLRQGVGLVLPAGLLLEPSAPERFEPLRAFCYTGASSKVCSD